LYGELYTTYSEVTYDIKRKTDKQVSDVHYSKIGDVIIPTSGETPEEIATATCVMIPNVILAGDLNIYRTNKVDGRIISFIINHKVNDKISKVAQGKSVVHIKADEIGKISINYPDYAEQQKIASFLEIIDQRIAKQRELIENLKSYKRGALYKLFPKYSYSVPKLRIKQYTDTWLSVKLGNILNTHSFKTYIHEANESGEYPVIQQGNEPIAGYSDGKAYENFDKVVLFGDHTLSLYKPNSKFFVASDGIKILSAKCLERDFLYYLLERYMPNSEGYKRHFSIIKELEVYYPSKEEQNEISKIISVIDEKIKLEEQLLQMLEKQKASLYQQLFI